MLAEKALRRENSIVSGQAYNIVDGGKTVDSWRFWYPLIEAAGASPPRISIPYWMIYAIALLMEYLYLAIGIPPILTRFEVRWLLISFSHTHKIYLTELQVNLIAITNTFSIDKAIEHLGYAPLEPNLETTAAHFRRTAKRAGAGGIGRLWDAVQKVLMFLSCAIFLFTLTLRFFPFFLN